MSRDQGDKRADAALDRLHDAEEEGLVAYTQAIDEAVDVLNYAVMSKSKRALLGHAVKQAKAVLS